MKNTCVVFIVLILFFSRGYAQVDSIQPINENKNLVDSLPVNSTLPHLTINSETLGRLKNSVYELNPAVDIVVVAVGTGWSLYAFTKIYKKGASTEQQILNLKTSDIPSFDRNAVRAYSKSLDRISYYPFYAAIPLPLVFFLTGDEMRSDFLQLGFLYWETMSVEGLFGTGATYFVDRYRPYAYSSATPMDQRMDQNAKNSFYAGHVQIISTSTFFIAKVYSDYYPDSKIKWVFYGAATAATGTMAYLRYQAGMHFPSDILLGSAMGALTGILVPQFHKHRLIKNHDLGMIPVINGESMGFALYYK